MIRTRCCPCAPSTRSDATVPDERAKTMVIARKIWRSPAEACHCAYAAFSRFSLASHYGVPITEILFDLFRQDCARHRREPRHRRGDRRNCSRVTASKSSCRAVAVMLCEEVVAAIAAEGGKGFAPCPLISATSRRSTRCSPRLDAQGAPLDLLVNNAAANRTSGPMLDMPLSAVRQDRRSKHPWLLA